MSTPPSRSVRGTTRRAPRLAASGALLLGLLLTRDVAAEQVPLVLIILDTSGSMSYVQQELQTPVCTSGEAKDPSLTYGYSRDMVAKEVLTGTFDGFWCRERERPAGRFDRGYPIPWLTPEFSSQSFDGILDTKGGDVKFGLMAFDTELSAALDQAGGWSTGPTAAAVPSVGITNLGVMNADGPYAGLVIPTPKDDYTSVRDNNQAVQDAVLAAIPYGGTPIAPALEDALWLLRNHPRLVKKVGDDAGDPYANCRPKNVLLITDGRPNLGEGTLGYKTSVKAAEALYKAGYSVYVVGFSLEAGVTSIVDDIAEAGGTEKARLASTPAELAAALSAILAKAKPGIESRTETVVTNITGSTTDLQYQVNTAYSGRAPSSEADTAGYMEVTAYRCEPECKDPESGGAGPCEVTDVRKLMNESSGARVMKFVLDGRLYPFETGTEELTPDVLGIPTSGEATDPTGVLDVQEWNLDIGGASQPKLDLGVPASRLLYRDKLIAVLRGETGTRRQKERLAGIWHSTPAIQTNLSNIDLPIPSFTKYKQGIAARPTMLYVATLDGFLHAFHLSQPGDGSPKDTGWLDEVWAIAPQQVTGRMHLLGDRSWTLMDGVPAVKDIRLEKRSAQIPLDDEVLLWRSVVVVPYRDGGQGLFAVDVTDPFQPFVRWEIAQRRHCYATGDGAATCKTWEDGDAHDFRLLGKTHGAPKIGTVFLHDDDLNEDHEVAAVFFGCGAEGDAVPPKVDPGDPPVDFTNATGRCFMVVRLDNGKKIKEFKSGDGSVTGHSGAMDAVEGTLTFPVVGDPAAYNSFTGNLVTRVFVGDEGGQLWRIDVSSKDPDDWTMQHFFDTYYNDHFLKESLASKKRSPLKTEPSLSPVPQRGQLVVVVSSGDKDYDTDLARRNVIFSLKEKLVTNPLTGAFIEGKVKQEVNWRRELNVGENFTTKPLIFGSTVYFGSFERDATDACKGGTGRIWGLHFLERQGTIDPVGTFDTDGDPTTKDDVGEYVEIEDSIPSGVGLISRPACAGDQGIEAAVGSGNANVPAGSGKTSALKASSSGQLELVVQTGATGETSTASNPKKGSTPPEVKKFTQKLVRPARQVISVSWGQVQNL